VASDRAKFEADHRYVRDRIEEFFGRRSVGRCLNQIDEIGITGWEKWWQVEFATWLADHDKIGDWVMEEEFLTDLRKSSGKERIAIDLGFRMKGFSTQEMLFLELKQNGDAYRCIDNMLVDVEKVQCAQKRSISNDLMIRNFFVVGLYRTPSDAGKADLRDYILSRCEDRDIEIEPADIYTKYVPDSPFSVTMF
jgi:hypothetical protein